MWFKRKEKDWMRPCPFCGGGDTSIYNEYENSSFLFTILTHSCDTRRDIDPKTSGTIILTGRDFEHVRKLWNKGFGKKCSNALLITRALREGN